MRRTVSLLILLTLITGTLSFIADADGTREPTREDHVDIVPTLNLPLRDGSYQTEYGLRGNVTIKNMGNVVANQTGRVSMVIKNKNNGQVAFTGLTQMFTNISPGGQRNITFQNWTSAYAGQFICNVSVLYPGDSNISNNYVEVEFTMWTEHWPFPPSLETWSVDPQKGNTSTDFRFLVKYVHNIPPDVVKLEIDGTNVTMTVVDPEDDIYQDGKYYEFITKLPVGNHRYRIFAEVTGFSNVQSKFSTFPWVNLSLKNPNVTPTSAYVTTPFKFSVDYGSIENLAPDEIYLSTNGKRFDLTRSSPTPNYIKGNVRFETDIKGIDLIPSPVDYEFNVATGTDLYTIGPFRIAGPSMNVVNISGTVTDEDMLPMEGVKVTLIPGGTTLTDELGRYSLEAYEAPNYRIIYEEAGYLTKDYSIDILEDRRLDIELLPEPSAASLSGYVLMEDGGSLIPLEGALIDLTGTVYSNETYSGPDGYYLLGEIPAGSDYVLTAFEQRFEAFELELEIENGEQVLLNITLIERPMGISISPSTDVMGIDVEPLFTIGFPGIPDMETVSVELWNATSMISVSVANLENSTEIRIEPDIPLLYDVIHQLRLASGVSSVSGNLMVWRDLKWDYRTEKQSYLEIPVSDPLPDDIDVELNQVIELSWGIGLNLSSLSYTLMDLDRVEEVEISLEYDNFVDWNDSGRTDTHLKFTPAELSYDTRYSLDIDGGLEDIYGRILFPSTYSLEFMTIGEPDRDGDGVADSLDAFPDDPLDWSDRDNDGYGDQTKDLFPDDPLEWMDTDGDGIGDNSDTDDDNDGMPDEWESLYGLDPLDPSDAFSDLDDDGSTNLEEYLEETDPSDAGSRPETAEDEIPVWAIIGGIAFLLVVVIIALMLVIRSKDTDLTSPEE